jgi:hypothetical protein
MLQLFAAPISTRCLWLGFEHIPYPVRVAINPYTASSPLRRQPENSRFRLPLLFPTYRKYEWQLDMVYLDI